MKKQIISCLAGLTAAACLCACSSNGFSDSQELSKGYERKASVEETYNFSDGAEEPPAAYNNYAGLITNFELKLFRKAYAMNYSGVRNPCFSPVGTALNLSLLSNGASKGTLQDILIALGSGLDTDTLNQCSSYFKSRMLAVNSIGVGNTDELSGKTTESDPNVFLTMDNVLLIDDETDVRTPFLQKNADFYGADVFRFSFSDNGSWSKLSERFGDGFAVEHDGLESNSMVPCSRLMIGDRWLDSYKADDIKSGEFYDADGKKSEAVYLCSQETCAHTDSAEGALKYTLKNPLKLLYIMPKSVGLDEYIARFDYAELDSLLNSIDIKERTAVQIPEIIAEQQNPVGDISKPVVECGLASLFNDSADFGNMAHTSGLKVGTVDELSPALTLNSAGISTARPEAEDKASGRIDDKALTFDRPFMVVVLDNESNIPLYICVKNY